MRPSKQKSRTMRRVYKTTPGGRNKVDYVLRKPKKLRCFNCNNELHGIPRLRPIKLSNLAKTKRRPQRALGGVMCSACSRRAIIEKSRGKK